MFVNFVWITFKKNTEEKQYKLIIRTKQTNFRQKSITELASYCFWRYSRNGFRCYTYNIKKRKRSKKRSARELPVCVSSRWNPRQNLINDSEAKNEVCRPRCIRKAISKPTFIDTSQKLHRNIELHIRTLQWATPCSSSASVSLEQWINTYSLFQEEKKSNAVSHLTT